MWKVTESLISDRCSNGHNTASTSENEATSTDTDIGSGRDWLQKLNKYREKHFLNVFFSVQIVTVNDK